MLDVGGGPAQVREPDRVISQTELAELLALFCTRPRKRDRRALERDRRSRGLSVRGGRVSDNQLPILVLRAADPAERGRVASEIEQWCHQLRPCPIPAVRRPAPGPGESLSELLAGIRHGLATPQFGNLPPFRFPRSELTETIISFARRGEGDGLRRRLVADLARRDRLARAMRAAPAAAEQAGPAGGADAGQPPAAPDPGRARGRIGAWLADAASVLALLANPVLRWRLRTQLPSLGGAYRWFRTNKNANRGMQADTNFFSNVYFLTQLAMNLPAFDDYASSLLASAMLDDLQASYRRGPRPGRGWARPVYPVLILDEVPEDSARARLLLQINRDRLVAGRWDPLLVVAVVSDEASYRALRRGARTEAAGTREDGGPLAGETPQELFRDWSSQFPGAMRPVARSGWFLFRSAGGGRMRTGLPTRRRPLWTRAPAQLAAVLLALAVAAGAALTWSSSQARDRTARQAAAARQFCAPGVRRLGDGECTGVAPAGFSFGDQSWTASLSAGTAVRPGVRRLRGDLTVTQLQGDISGENAQVARQAARTGNAVVTIVYMGPLTLRGKVSNPQTDGVRELAGVYYAQQAWDSTPADGVQNQPLIQILVANAGASMTSQLAVAREITRMAAGTAPVVGVVGVGMNEPSTPATVLTFQRAGIPVIGTTNSMDTRYSFYFQLAPDDQREAQVGVSYLATLRGPLYGVRLVDATSGYTQELGRDVGTALAASPGPVPPLPQLPPYTSPRQLVSLAAGACAQTGGKLNLIYYIGRSQDMYWLLQGLSDSPCAENSVRILSGDDASKYAAPLPGNVTLDYTALTFPGAWPDCYRRRNVPSFYAAYLGWLQAQGLTGLPSDALADPLLADGHTVLGYDATMAMENATTQVYETMAGPAAGLGTGPVRVTPGAVWGQLRSGAEPPGATGTITFQPGYERSKFVAVVQVQQSTGAGVVYAQGSLVQDVPQLCPGG